MPFDIARGILTEKISAFPIVLWSNWPRRKTAAAIRTNIFQELLSASPAEGAFKCANHRFC
jgi:hypothetical protein